MNQAVSPDVQRRRVRTTIFLSICFSGLAMTVILPILAPLIRELGLSESQGGWMVSIGSVVMALIGVFWGRRSDRLGRKSVILAGFLGLFLSYAIFTTVVWLGFSGALVGAGLFAALLVARALVGAFLPAVPSASQAYMADVTTPQERSSGMALISAANGVGMVVGPALAGILAMFGLIWPLLLVVILPLLAFFVIGRVLPDAPVRQTGPVQKISPFDPDVRGWLLIGLMTMTTIVTLQISAGFYFQDQLGLTGTQTARMLATSLTLVGVTLMVTQFVQIRYLKWQSRRMALTGSPLVAAGLLVMLLTQSEAAYYVAYVLIGMGAGMLFPGYMSGASLSVGPARQGAVAGLIASTQGMGAIIAPLGSTLLYEQNRYMPFAVLVGLMAVAWLAAWWVKAPARPVVPAQN